MEATVLMSFLDKKNKVRYYTGDVVEIPKADFDRISKKGKLLKAGRHRFGRGKCHPCSSKPTAEVAVQTEEKKETEVKKSKK